MPGIQTIVVTQITTKLITKQITQLIIKRVDLPVTVTPETTLPSAQINETSHPYPTSENSTPLQVTILMHSDCYYGPSDGYLYKYTVFTGDAMEAIGRNPDGTWLDVQTAGGWNPCWIRSALADINSGNINALPVIYPILPYSDQYNPPDATAHRVGANVTISWKAVWMSLDDYRGYLIEARLCQDGSLIFDPISYMPPLASNSGTLSINVTDGPGCDSPSSARIYTAVKQGYSNWTSILWPAY